MSVTGYCDHNASREGIDKPQAPRPLPAADYHDPLAITIRNRILGRHGGMEVEEGEWHEGWADGLPGPVVRVE